MLMNVPFVFRAVLGVSLVACFAGCAVDSSGDPQADEDVGETSEALTTSLVAWGAPSGLIQSTGNLYWTVNSFNDVTGQYGAAVRRGAKTNTPGAESTLYQETAYAPVRFGDITYANPGVWYGYFVASYGTTSQIKRVPLAGGAAVTLATSPATIGDAEVLDNDGTYLYWADASGLRRMALGGGAITTLASLSGIKSVGLDASNVYVATGNTVYSVPKGGGALTWRASGYDALMAMHVVPGSPTTLYWSERGGRVAKKPVGGTTTFVYTPTSSYDALSVYFDGSRLLWTECTSPGWSTCTVYSKLGSNAPITWGGGVGAGHLQGDATTVFWGNASALYRAKY